MRALVVGGSGGIGNALVEALLQRGLATEITATWHQREPKREHPRLRWQRTDVTDETDIASLAQSLPAVDWVINTVGMLHRGDRRPEKAVRQLDGEFFLQNLAVNALPTLLLAKHVEPLLRRSGRGLFAAVSARVGSIGDNRLGGWYSYRCAKAALNMALKSLSLEWGRSAPSVCVAALHPGTTDTDLSRPFQRSVPPEQLFTAQRSAAYMLATLSRLTPADSGGFWSWNGERLPW